MCPGCFSFTALPRPPYLIVCTRFEYENLEGGISAALIPVVRLDVLGVRFQVDLDYITITNLSLAVSMVSLRDLGSTIPGGPVSSVHWSALLRTERAKPTHGLLGAEQPSVNNKDSS